MGSLAVKDRGLSGAAMALGPTAAGSADGQAVILAAFSEETAPHPPSLSPPDRSSPGSASRDSDPQTVDTAIATASLASGPLPQPPTRPFGLSTPESLSFGGIEPGEVTLSSPAASPRPNGHGSSPPALLDESRDDDIITSVSTSARTYTLASEHLTRRNQNEHQQYHHPDSALDCDNQFGDKTSVSENYSRLFNHSTDPQVGTGRTTSIHNSQITTRSNQDSTMTDVPTLTIPPTPRMSAMRRGGGRLLHNWRASDSQNGNAHNVNNILPPTGPGSGIRVPYPHSGLVTRSQADVFARSNNNGNNRPANSPGPGSHLATHSNGSGGSSSMDDWEPSTPISPISTAAMNVYAYALSRPDGSVTRLIPADQLPPLHGIPMTEPCSIGLLVLPVPAGVAPSGRVAYDENERVMLQKMIPRDKCIQDEIDKIVATTPTPIAHRASGGGGSNGTRKPKVYCDKWVHEGVCAFTQQGCKYKHEMPFDRATQHQLGLFHGLPTWWKKHQAELARQRDIDAGAVEPFQVFSSRDSRHASTGPGAALVAGIHAAAAASGMRQDSYGPSSGGVAVVAGGAHPRQQHQQTQQRGLSVGNSWRPATQGQLVSLRVASPAQGGVVSASAERMSPTAVMTGGNSPESIFRQTPSVQSPLRSPFGPIGPPARQPGDNDLIDSGMGSRDSVDSSTRVGSYMAGGDGRRAINGGYGGLGGLVDNKMDEDEEDVVRLHYG